MTLTRIEYMYRDFSNWKWYGEFFVSGRITLTQLRPYLWDETQFNPLKLGIPHLLDEPVNQDDHFMHEILSFEETAEGTPVIKATEMLKQCSQIGSIGWL